MELKLAQCARCRGVYPRVKSPVCQACQPEEDADFEKIRGVLDYDSELLPEQVADTANVPVDCVLRMLDAGLISAATLGESIRCGRCGAPAISRSKRLCQACVVRLDAGFSNAVSVTRKNKRTLDEIALNTIHVVVDSKRQGPKKKGKQGWLKRNPPDSETI